MTKKQPKKKAARAVHAAPVAPEPAPPSEQPVDVTAAPPAPAPAPPPKPVVGRLHRSTLTPAGVRGRALVRFLRIHTKHPYAKRGEDAIYLLAREVARLGLGELDAAAAGGNR